MGRTLNTAASWSVGSTGLTSENPIRQNSSSAALAVLASKKVNHKQFGAAGERYARAHLLDLGWSVIDQNWRNPAGEIDLVAIDHETDTLVFVEVKTRRGTRYGSGLEAITQTKVAQLRKLAALWLSTYRLHGVRVRIDAISVLKLPGKAPLVEHVRGVQW